MRSSLGLQLVGEVERARSASCLSQGEGAGGGESGNPLGPSRDATGDAALRFQLAMRGKATSSGSGTRRTGGKRRPNFGSGDSTVGNGSVPNDRDCLRRGARASQGDRPRAAVETQHARRARDGSARG